MGEAGNARDSKDHKLRLTDILVPKKGQTQQEYQQAIDDFKKDIPAVPSGKKTYARYRDCLVKAAEIVSTCWDTLDIDDGIIHRQKQVTTTGSSRILETAPLRIIQTLATAIEASLPPPQIPVERFKSAMETALEKIRDNPDILDSVENGHVMKGASLKHITKAAAILENNRNSNMQYPPMDALEYVKADKQVKAIKDAVEKLMKEIKAIDDVDVKPVKRALNKLSTDFYNEANAFTEQQRGRRV